MAYGKLKEKTEEFATYQVGTALEDMTGLVAFFRDGREPVLKKQAEEYAIRLPHIVRLYGKYNQKFLEGAFPEKIAYERG